MQGQNIPITQHPNYITMIEALEKIISEEDEIYNIYKEAETVWLRALEEAETGWRPSAIEEERLNVVKTRAKIAGENSKKAEAATFRKFNECNGQRILIIKKALDSLSKEQRSQLIFTPDANGNQLIDHKSIAERNHDNVEILPLFFKRIIRNSEYLTEEEKIKFLIHRDRIEGFLIFTELIDELSENEKKALRELIVNNKVVITRKDLSENQYRPGRNFLLDVVSTLPDEKRSMLNQLSTALLASDEKGNTSLYFATEDFKTLQVFLKILEDTKDLEQHKIAEAIFSVNQDGISPLQQSVASATIDNGLLSPDGTRFLGLELLLKKLSPEQIANGLTQKDKSGMSVLYKLFKEMLSRAQNAKESTVEKTEFENLLVKNFLALLPPNNTRLKEVLLNPSDLNSPFFSLGNREVINTLLKHLGEQPPTETEMKKEKGDILLIIEKRIWPQRTIAREIIKQTEVATKLERQEMSFQRMAGDRESAMRNTPVLTAKTHFNYIKRYLRDVFYGLKPEECPTDVKGWEELEKSKEETGETEKRLIAIEKDIRQAILTEIKSGLEWEKENSKSDEERKEIAVQIQWIAENENKLVSGDPEILKAARDLNYFSSTVDVAQIAWRCYDAGATTVKLWPNLLTPPPESEKNQQIFSTAASRETLDGDTREKNSKIIRIMAAYYFLLARDPNEGTQKEREERVLSFIRFLSEVRRAHNDSSRDPANEDSFSCGPGFAGRIVYSVPLHSKAAMHKSRFALIQEKMGQLIALQFSKELGLLDKGEGKPEDKTKEKCKLLMALIILSEDTAQEIIDKPSKFYDYLNIMDLEEVSAEELLKMRKQFIEKLWSKEESLLEKLNDMLLQATGIGLRCSESLESALTQGSDWPYVTLTADTNVGGLFISQTLNASYSASELDRTLKMQPEAEKKEEKEVRNPFAGFERLPEKLKEKRMKQFNAFKSVFDILCDVLKQPIQKNILSKKDIGDFTKELVEEFFVPNPPKVSDILTKLKGPEYETIKDIVKRKEMEENLTDALNQDERKTKGMTPAADLVKQQAKQQKEKEEKEKAAEGQTPTPKKPQKR